MNTFETGSITRCSLVRIQYYIENKNEIVDYNRYSYFWVEFYRLTLLHFHFFVVVVVVCLFVCVRFNYIYINMNNNLIYH